jgi:hypothetical protein
MSATLQDLPVFSVGLYRESGGKPGVVLFLADDKDWTSHHLKRHGDRLCAAISPRQCIAYRDQRFRACSLHYDGTGKQKAEGFEEDLIRLGFEPADRARFLSAAQPHWPNKFQ